MERDAAELLRDALALPSEVRAALVDSLIGSLDRTVDAAAESAIPRNATIWIYYWIYGEIRHEYHATETSAEPLSEASWPARDGPIRGPGARRRSRVDPVARKAARWRWPRLGAYSRHCPSYDLGGTVEKGGILNALRRSPLVGADLDLNRPPTPGRRVDL